MHHHIALHLLNIILVASSSGGNPELDCKNAVFPWFGRGSLDIALTGNPPETSGTPRKPPETLGTRRNPLGKHAGNPGIQMLGMVFEMPGAPQKPSEILRIKFTEKLAPV